MRVPWSYEFDEAAYLRDHPEAKEASSVYEHFVARCPESELDRYRIATPHPTVSIIVPCYEAEEFLEHTLESIRRQTFQSWECICVDDLSTDGTLAVIKKYLAKDKRFKIIPHRANGGLSAARNSGIRSARGRFVCFLDSDDLIMPTSIANRVHTLAVADNARLGGSYSASVTIDEQCHVPPPEEPAPNMKLVDFITAAGMCPFNSNQPMFKTSVLRLLGGFDERLKQAEDWDLWMRILRHGYYFVPTKVTDVTYRQRYASMVRSDPLLHLESALAIHAAVHATLPQEKTCDFAPFVYRKPWIEYKRQLDLARRVIEFAGMAMSTGRLDDRAVELSTRALPDFFDAIAPHRDLAHAFRAGVSRQMVGTGPEIVRYAAQQLMSRYVELWNSLAISEPRQEGGSFPEQVGQNIEEHRSVDVVFLPHKDYHVWSFSLVLDALREAGITYTFVDLTVVYRDEGSRSKLDELRLPRVPYNEFVLGWFRPKMVVCMNDWDPIVRRIVTSCQLVGIPTIGVVEGVQDYLDVDTGRVRAPYRTVDYVLLPGEFDRRYFPANDDRVRVGGVPRIDGLLAEESTFPEQPLVVINSNFTYNVLTTERDAWISQTVAACQQLGYEYVISRHPADHGDFSGYNVATESMYELIRRGSVFVSRFGSGILEALAMGKPSIYFNPHGEKVDKFTEPNGAFPISRSPAELVEDLRSTVLEPERYLRHADDYIELHCGVRRDSGMRASERLGDAIVDIFKSAFIPPVERRARLKEILVHRDERLLGEVRLRARNGVWAVKNRGRTNGAAHAIWEARNHLPGLNDRSYPAQWKRLRRKYRKLRRDPRAFFEDSQYAPLNALRRFFQDV